MMQNTATSLAANPKLHVTLRGPIKAEVVYHCSEKAFSVLMFNREKSSRPLMLDPLSLSAGHPIKNQFKYVLLQIECIMRKELGEQRYASLYSTARDINLPKEILGYESTTMCVDISIDDIYNCLHHMQ